MTWSASGSSMCPSTALRSLSNFDVLATAGRMSQAVVEQFFAAASSSGKIVIAFAPTASSLDQNAEVSGIEVIPTVLSTSPIVIQGAMTVAYLRGPAILRYHRDVRGQQPGCHGQGLYRHHQLGRRHDHNRHGPTGSQWQRLRCRRTHTYAKTGNFAPVITIQTYDGARNAFTGAVTVSNPMQSIGTATTYNVTTNTATGSVVVGTFTDASRRLRPSPPRSTGETGRAVPGFVVAITGAYNVVANHTYTTAGTYAVTVTVTSGVASLVMTNTTIVVAAALSDLSPLSPTPPAAAPVSSSVAACHRAGFHLVVGDACLEAEIARRQGTRRQGTPPQEAALRASISDPRSG